MANGGEPAGDRQEAPTSTFGVADLSQGLGVRTSHPERTSVRCPQKSRPAPQCRRRG